MAVDVAEVPAVQRPRDFSFYLVLVIIVFPLRSVIPLSWAFLIYAFNSGKIWLFSWLGQTLMAIALSEAIFSIYHYRLVHRISRFAPSVHCNLPEIQTAFKRLLKVGLAGLSEDGGDEESLHRLGRASPGETIIQLEQNDPRAVDFRNSLRPWFQNAAWSSLRLLEVQQWIFWSIYNADMPPFDQLSPVQEAIMDEALKCLEMRIGCSIPEGSNPQTQPMRLTIDPIKIQLRPLLLYTSLALINRCFRGWIVRRYQMKYGSHQGLEYLIHIPKAWNGANGPRPVLFIHGLGLGLLQYSIFLCHLLNAIIDRPVLVLLQPQISQEFLHSRHLDPLGRLQTVEKLLSLLVELGWVDQESAKASGHGRLTSSSKTKGITVLSHSNGSYTHAWLLKDCSNIVTRSCFVDPVTFCSWEGDVCYNFVYRNPATGMDLLMRYFVAAELGVANLLQRHFDWASNSLWYEEIPDARDPTKNVFVLGGKDAIVNSERVLKYLRSHGVQNGIWYDPDGRHGQALTGGPGLIKILGWLKEE